MPNPAIIWEYRFFLNYCKLKFVTPSALPWLGLKGRKFLNLGILERWKMHFQGQFYIKIKFSGRFFWAPIPVKRYQNTSGFGTDVIRYIAESMNKRLLPCEALLYVIHTQNLFKEICSTVSFYKPYYKGFYIILTNLFDEYRN